MARRKARKVRITKGEKLIYMSGFICMLGTILLQVFCGANISHLNMSIEQIRYEITEQDKKNESLSMKVNELTSFSKVEGVVKEMGLAYNNDNIIIINE